jgi:LAO/AO transport system kinase
VKKGIVEVSDMIIVTKADGDLLSTAKHTAADYKGAMQFLSSITADELGGDCGCALPTQVVLASSVTGLGLDRVWSNILQFRDHEIASGRLELRRRAQSRYWLWKEFQNAVQEQTENDPLLQSASDAILQELDQGIIPPRVAATVLLKQLNRRHQQRHQQS